MARVRPETSCPPEDFQRPFQSVGERVDLPERVVEGGRDAHARLQAEAPQQRLRAEVSAAELDFLPRTSLMETFEADRRKGIGYVIRTLREAAAEGNDME